jgi:hypothetical protein
MEVSAKQRRYARIYARTRLGRASEHPCFICGDTASDWDHFHGYSLECRLIVIPVCRSCHWKLVWARGEHHSPPACTHGNISRRKCRICMRENEAAKRARDVAAGKVRRSPFVFPRCPHGLFKKDCKPCRNERLRQKRLGIAPQPCYKRVPLNPDHIISLKKQGFLQVDLAWAFGVSSTTVSRIVNGKLDYARGSQRARIAEHRASAY